MYKSPAIAGALLSLAYLAAAPAKAASLVIKLVTFVTGAVVDGNSLPHLPIRAGPNRRRRRDQGADAIVIKLKEVLISTSPGVRLPNTAKA
jgi:hypothetical protein